MISSAIKAVLKAALGLSIMLIAGALVLPFQMVLGADASPQLSLIFSLTSIFLMLSGFVLFAVGSIQFVVRSGRLLVSLGRSLPQDNRAA